MSTQALFPCGGGSKLILVMGMENQIFILRTPSTIKFFHQIPKNFHFSVKKKSFITHMDLYIYLHISSPTLFPRGIITFQGVLTKFNFFMKFQFHGGGSNLILGTGMENQIFILRTPAAVKFFYRIVKK